MKQKELVEKSPLTVKLPKISITKFNGTPLDWVRFEGKFNTTVVSRTRHDEVCPFKRARGILNSKCPRLPSVQRARLCLSTEILWNKYGHPSEVAGSYVINLLELAQIPEKDVVKIHQFYKKLLFNVDSLATLGKLNTIQGAALLVIIRKLELLKSELMTHVTGDWSDWTDRGTDKCATAKRSFTLPQGRAFQSHDRNANKYSHGVFIVTKCLHQQNIKRS